MRRRFLIRSSLSDLLSLGAAIVVASLYVFGTVLPGTRLRAPSIPMVYMTLSLILFSFLTAQMSGPGVRAHLWADVRHLPRHRWADRIAPAVQPAVLLEIVPARHRRFWLVLAGSHRIVRRLRPWTERIAVITGEKQLAEDLIDSPHAEIVWVLEPKSETVPDLPDRDVTMAVDLRVVLSERVAQFLSSCDVAGYTIRPFTSTYENTGRVPLVHLAEGWEISAPLLEVAPWLPASER